MDLQDIFCITTLASLLVALVEAENPQIIPSQQQNVHHMNQQQKPSRFRDKQHIQDKEHLKEHYDGFIDFDNLNYDKMRDDEIAFHYFKIHDTDNNNRLDGLEIMSGMLHNKDFKRDLMGGWRNHDDEEEEDYEEDYDGEPTEEQIQKRMMEEQSWQGENAKANVFDEAAIIAIVNQVLSDDDLNDDGYVDFPEFLKSNEF